MRILIVGAGIGGMTLAALLDRWGIRPTIVERAPDFRRAGYMLGLWPLGSRVLHGLGLSERFREVSVPMLRYEVRDGRGRVTTAFDLASASERLGTIRDTTRPELVELLRSSLSVEIAMGRAFESLEQRGSEVLATFSDGTEDAFDLVVGADGIHSRVRACAFGEAPTFETGWGGWVWWAPTSLVPAERVVEYWAAGRFLGVYPTRQAVGVFAAAPLGSDFERPGAGRRERLRGLFSSLGSDAAPFLEAIPEDEAEMFFWRLADARSRDWVRGRVVLLGDAGAGFLPTAGVGASMAMESAAVLADELSRSEPSKLELALAHYVARRRRRVESIQRDSRRLSRVMFVRGRVVAKARDLVTRLYTTERFCRTLARALEEPI